ncbi:MAG TPA: glycine zipper 2TM domain-containing protein [Burkholderiales bacterium]|nr:glycine zipper 2TM domain-containing protein [Burkholderiales bacterium]
MQATNTSTRLHPLLTAAAISVSVFSAVGVAAITGLVPSSIGSSKSVEIPKEIAQPVAPAIAHPVPAPAPAPIVEAPAPKPAVKKQVTKKPVEPVVYRDFPQTYPAPVAQAETPKPVVPAGHVGTVQGVREVTQKGEHTLMGPAAGGIAGAVIGNQIGEGNMRKILTVVGAAGGAIAGREIEKHARGKKQWEIDVRLDNGAHQVVTSEVEPPYRAGDRIRVVDGRLQPA